MTTANYIKDLLYRYDCVIVPNFGGFVTNRISARINTDSNTFYPPTKEVGFNSHLTHNDGLLANYIASVENISFEKANATILETVSEWNTAIKTEAVVLENVGSFSLNEKNQLIFSPTNTINYLTSSFGLISLAYSIIYDIPAHPPAWTPTLTPIVELSALDIISLILLAALSLSLITCVINLILILLLQTFYLYSKVGPKLI